MPQLNSAHSRLGLIQLVDVQHTCVHPAGFVPDPALVKEIRVFFPEFVPVFRIEEYVTPTGNYTRGYHCIGLWQATVDPTREEPLTLERGADFPFNGGVVYLQQAWGIPPNKEGQKLGLPSEYLPFDHNLVEWMRQEHFHYARSADDYKQRIMQKLADQQKAEDKAVSDAEEDARLSLIDDKRQIAAAIAAGRIYDPPAEHAPFVGQLPAVPLNGDLSHGKD